MNSFDNNPRDYSTNNHNYPNEYLNRYDSDEVVTLGTWIGVLFITGIPLVNIIGLLVMAFGVENKNIRNYARASLILLVIGFAIVLLLKGCS
ncbi:hypothetical protein [Brassicibacter mesophilus]|uniref:hypothetical protein n=1 Tax=Brassicibacter mesophilus TaxID=745119 RepID=UPI003D2525F3